MKEAKLGTDDEDVDDPETPSQVFFLTFKNMPTSFF